MPPLSAYTAFESLLFFQSLAGLDTRPTNFVPISDLLRNNRFVRDNVAFDAHRLSPEALEGLYTTLMRDGFDSAGTASTLAPNGHPVEAASPSNPKKRKITSPRPEGLSDKGLSQSGYVPGLVTHLYAKYKELVTKEIRNEEKRFKEIRDEIERLQKEEREAPATPIPAPTPGPVPQAKQIPVPEPMDLDTPEKPVERPAPPKEPQPTQAIPTASVEAKQLQPELQRKELKQPSAQTTPHPLPVVQHQPAQIPKQPAKSPAKKLQAQTQPPVQVQQQPKVLPQQSPPSQPQIQAQLQLQQQPQTPAVPLPNEAATPARPNAPQPPNGKVQPIPQQPNIAPRATPTQTNVPPLQQQKGPPTAAVGATGPGPTKPVGTPLQAQQPSGMPVPSPTPQKPIQLVKSSGKKGQVAATPITTAPPRPPQSSFQQWSLNEPQTPQPPPSFPVSVSPSQSKPTPSPFPQPAPKQEIKAQAQAQAQQAPKPGPPPVTVPSTPGPTPAATQSPMPSFPGSGFQTPVGPAKPLPLTGARGSRPRLSIATPGSLTPWKQTPMLTLPHSPRSPDRPRAEDVSPISEKAPSPFRSREATPEEPEPRRRKRRSEGKGAGRGREKGTDGESKPGRPKKGDKATGTAGKKRDRSTASSRSRGRSVVSRDDESAPESGPAAQGKIKREMPSTPAGILESTEPERTPAARKGATTDEPKPGRGRPKRKRAPSEVPEPEPPQPEPSQLNRVDSNQSTSFVLGTRNFPRTGAPIMNDVTTHKHGSIFTKPLTERDAPGYRDLIYRPQDLKSIKSSITQGSRALAAATEAANTPVADGESPAPNTMATSKNAVLMLQKTEDVIPPKGIVNSAQLEKELIRMFANAVMFNPVPQRGFGLAFPMIGDGGSRERVHAPEPDEGGIIKDTLEMFEDVEQAVTRWRAAERTADELASKSILSLRRGSASDPNTDSADDVKG